MNIVSEGQFQQILAHDRFDELNAAESSADALFTLVAMGLVSEAELDRQAEALEAAADPAGAGQALSVIDETRDTMAAVVRGFNREQMDVLLELGLIDAEQRDAGEAIRPQRVEGVLDSPAKALAALVNRGIVTEEQFDAMKALSADTSQQVQFQQRNAVVDEAARRYHEIVGQYVKAMSSGVLRSVGLLLLIVFSVIGLMVWLFK